jgi:mercuric ion transport protein
MKMRITSGTASTDPGDSVRARTVAAIGSFLAALAASSCCLLPVTLFTLGAGGAWIGTLVRLAPLQPYFIAAAVVCLRAGYWLVYRPHVTCAVGGGCGAPVGDRVIESVLGLATGLIVLAIGFNLIAPLLSS